MMHRCCCSRYRSTRITGRPRDLLESVMDRPGHDRRYAIDARKMERELGWRPRWEFARGLESTVRWYQENEKWWRRILDGRYLVQRRRAHGGTREVPPK